MLIDDALRSLGSAAYTAVHPRTRRRVWTAAGRAHIEVRGVHRPGMEHVAAEVERVLRDLDGVDWAAVNAVAARVIVAFDEDRVDVGSLVDAVSTVEDAFGVDPGDVAPGARHHPADTDGAALRVVEIGADVAGIAVGFGARLIRVPMLPVELAAAVPAVDAFPPVRRVLDMHRNVEAAFVSTGALLQGFAQGPAGLVVDATHRILSMREAGARRALWQRVEPQLHSGPEMVAAAPLDVTARPEPLPDGLLETYARRIGYGSLAAGAAVLVLTRNPRRTADVMLAGVPRAARLGREAFAAQLTSVLSAREAVVMDPSVLRRLDRIDTVVVDGALLDEPADAVTVLAGAARDAAQDLVLALDDGTPAPPLDHDFTVRGGEAFAASVADLQREGRVVAVVSAQARAVLAAADCGIGVVLAVPPWGAHVLCPTLFDAALVVDATAAARAADRRIVAVAGAGSGLAALLAFGPAGAGRRTVLTTNTSALVAIGAGVWTAAELVGRRAVPGISTAPAWHALRADDAIARLRSAPGGLPAGEATARHTLPDDTRGPNLVGLMAHELANPLSAILGAGGILSTVAGSVSDGLLITGVLGANALVGATQRLQTERAIRHLSTTMAARTAHVKRAGETITVERDDLVDGDVLVVQAGDVIAADARITSASAIETDESSLTGESMPVAKGVEPVALDVPVAERSSMLYAGAAVASGQAEAVVVATGARTEARKGAGAGAAPPATGVEARLDDLTRRTVPLVLGAGALLTASSLLRRVPAREAVATGVSLAAAAVPEGLPFLATIAQSSAARRLSKHGVLVRNPRVLEALGRADVLCFDKTGTLTEGHPQLRSVSDGERVDPMRDLGDACRSVLAAAVRATPHRRRERLPHPTDQAVVDGAQATDVGAQLGADGWRKGMALPFEPSRGYHAVLGHTAAGPLLSVKGAPEVILPRCEVWRRGTERVALDGPTRKRLDAHIERLAAQGLRVLAVAERSASHDELDDRRVARLELSGFLTVADVTRASATAPIARLRAAGVTVVMLTGDHPRTAAAIGAELGLVNGHVVTGAEVDALDDAGLDELMQHADCVRPRDAGAQGSDRAVVPAPRADGGDDRRRRERRAGDPPRRCRRRVRTSCDLGRACRRRPRDRRRPSRAAHRRDRRRPGDVGVGARRARPAARREPRRGAVHNGRGARRGPFTTQRPPAARGEPPHRSRARTRDLAPATAHHTGRPAAGRAGSVARRSAHARDRGARAAATAAAATASWTVARYTGTPTRASTVALVALIGAQLGQTLAVGYGSPLVVASGLASTGALVAVVQTPGLSGFFGCRPLGPVGWTIAGTAACAATRGAVVAGMLLAPRNGGEDRAEAEIDVREDDHGGVAAEPAAAAHV